MFTVVHWAISVQDMERSIAFYEKFGFTVFMDNTMPDANVRIVRLTNGKFELELTYCPGVAANPAAGKSVPEDIMTAGAKHLALEADDLEQGARQLVASGALAEMPVLNKASRPGRGYCFLQDPDGIWLELVGPYNP